MDVDTIVKNKKEDKKDLKKEIEKPKEKVEVPKRKAILSWESSDNLSVQINPFVITLFVIFNLTAIAYFVWKKDWFPIPVIVIISGIFIWYKISIKEELKKYSIERMGVRINDYFYPYSEIHSFWIIYNDKVKNLYITFVKRYLPSIVIDLSNANPHNVKIALSRRIPEQTQKSENLLDKLVRLLNL